MILPRKKISGQGKSASDLKRLLWHKLSDHQKWIVEKMINEDAFIFMTYSWKGLECSLIFENDERIIRQDTFEKLKTLGVIKRYEGGSFEGYWIVP